MTYQKKYLMMFGIIFSVHFVFALSQQTEKQITAEEIIDKAETSYKGETSYGSFIMNIVRPDFSRSVKMDSWNEGNDKALIVITSPKKEALAFPISKS